jgi:Zn-dependent peptidase ImmA (M78 family)/transcriptional regulator with XRE-family HTH domain
MREQELINPAILVWARESAGLGIEEAARKLALGDSGKQTAEQKLLELERGERFPSRTQLNNLAKTYRRPLVAFYMNIPPKKAPRGEDFRSTGKEISPRDNALLDALLRDMRARQEMVRDILEDLDEAIPKDFVSSSVIADGVEVVARRIATALNFPARRSDWGNGPDEFFKRIRAETERLGVFVLLVGDLGNYRSALGEDVFRGFAVADPIAPFIVINDHDARTARSFTLVHELAHIYIGKSGVSGSPESVNLNSDKGRIEQFCNDVAGLVLLPRTFADQRPVELSRGDRNIAARYIEDVARRWMVSEPLVASRLRRLGWISATLYRELSISYVERWTSFKAETKAANQLKEGGPDYYVLRQSRLGDALLGVVHRSVRESRLTDTRAAKVLGVKPSSVENLLRRYEKSPASLKGRVAG